MAATVEVHCAGKVGEERPASLWQLGQRSRPQQVLQLLRHSPSGEHQAPAVPAGFNSGLSLRLYPNQPDET